MLPIILAAAALGLAAYSAYKLLQSMRQQPFGLPGDEPGDGRSRHHRPKQGQDDLIKRIVNSVVFSTKQMIISNKKVGELRKESNVPADDLEIRKMRSISELPKTLSQAQIYPDEIYYGMAVSNKLPVKQFIEKQDITEPEYGKARNILLVVQDISRSMEENDRTAWSIRLNQELIARCQKEEAEYALICFDTYSREPHLAKDKDELEQMKQILPAIISPDGGTDIEGALDNAIKFLNGENFAEKRIILITDGQDSVSLALKDKLKEAGATLHSICIASDNQDLRTVSDQYDILSEYN